MLWFSRNVFVSHPAKLLCFEEFDHETNILQTSHDLGADNGK